MRGIDRTWRPSATQMLLLRTVLGEKEEALKAWRNWQAVASLETADPASVFILPQLYDKLRQICPDDPAIAKLRGVSRHTWAKNRLALQGTREATQALSSAGIPALLLKGIPLLQRVYRDLGSRMMIDADIAIRREHFTAADRLLTELGWRAEPSSPRISLPPFLHAVVYRHPRWLDLDLHVDPLAIPCSQAALDGLWRRSQPLANMDSAAPDMTDLLLLTLIHGRKADGQGRLRWIVDATNLVRTDQIEWDTIPERAAELLVRPTILSQLRYLSEHLNAPIPQSTLKALKFAETSAIELERDRILYQIDPAEQPIWALLPQRWKQYSFACALADRPTSLWKFGRHCSDYLVWKYGLKGVWEVPRLLYRGSLWPKAIAARTAAR